MTAGRLCSFLDFQIETIGMLCLFDAVTSFSLYLLHARVAVVVVTLLSPFHSLAVQDYRIR